jgi:hypothetical protein
MRIPSAQADRTAGVVSFSSPCCLPLMPGYVFERSGAIGDLLWEVPRLTCGRSPRSAGNRVVREF